VGKAEDGYYDLCKSNSADGQKWIALPWTIVGAMIAYRKSWFDEIGSPTFPTPGRSIAGWQEAQTWAARRQTLATHSATRRRSATLFVVVGRQRDSEDGKTININKKEVIDSVKFMTALLERAHDEGGLAWDDTNNNRAFLSQTICATLKWRLDLHRVSAQPDSTSREGRAAKTDIQHAPLPKGPAGQFAMALLLPPHVIAELLEDQAAAKECRIANCPAGPLGNGGVLDVGFQLRPSR